MTQAADLTKHFRLFLLTGFLDAQTCASVRAEALSSPSNPAPVYIEGSSEPVHETVRKTTSFHPSEETVSYVHALLLQQTQPLAEHFSLSLTDCERPQFLRYREGDFFIRHQDGNTEQLEFDHLRIRKISVVVFLNDGRPEPCDEGFCGGSLVFYDERVESETGPLGFPLAGETGLLVAFPADTMHEVKPVTDGERFTIITWFR